MRPGERPTEDLDPRKVLQFLREHFHLSLADVQEVYADSPCIPLSAFSGERTVLETIVSELTSRGFTPGEIAQLCDRSSSIIRNALLNAQKKQRAVVNDADPYVIPVSILRESDLTPGEAIIYHLHSIYKLPNAHIAKLLGRDSRNAWAVLQRALKKRGGRI